MDNNKLKNVWITGAGKGIGRALAKLMVADGWTVAATSRTIEDLSSLINECRSGKVFAFPLDVSDYEETIATVHSIEKKMGNLDLVILNAGTHSPVSVTNFSTASVRNLMEVNFMGTVHLSLIHI